jgi:hypothetical protein
MKALSIKHIAQIRRDAEILAALGVKNDVDRRKPADQGATVGRQPQASQRNQLPDRARCPIGTRRTASPMNRDGPPPSIRHHQNLRQLGCLRGLCRTFSRSTIFGQLSRGIRDSMDRPSNRHSDVSALKLDFGSRK